MGPRINNTRRSASEAAAMARLFGAKEMPFGSDEMTEYLVWQSAERVKRSRQLLSTTTKAVSDRTLATSAPKARMAPH